MLWIQVEPFLYLLEIGSLSVADSSTRTTRTSTLPGPASAYEATLCSAQMDETSVYTPESSDWAACHFTWPLWRREELATAMTSVEACSEDRTLAMADESDGRYAVERVGRVEGDGGAGSSSSDGGIGAMTRARAGEAAVLRC